MNLTLRYLPPWALPLAWTLATTAVAYLIGLVVNAVVARRLERLAARTSGDWDDVLVVEVRKRIPFWAVLIGLHLSQVHWALSPQAQTLATRVLSGVGVISLTLAAAAVVSRLVAAYGPRVSPATPVPALAQNIARIVVIVLGALVAFRSFGYDITPMLTALGVGGIAVALALQEPLSSLFAGIFITVARQVRIGDYIQLDTGAEGYVVDFNWRAARLRQLSDNIVIVPNSKLAQAVVTNFTLPGSEMGIGVDFLVDHLSDLERVENVARDVASAVSREVEGGVPDSLPGVKFGGLAGGGVKVVIGLRVRSYADQYQIRHELVKRLHSRFRQEGIWLR